MRNRYILLADALLVTLCATGAFALRLDWLVSQYREGLVLYVVAALFTKPLIFYAFGLYRRYWRYASIDDLLAVLLAVSASALAMALLVTAGMMSGAVPWFPRSVLGIDWLLTLFGAAGARLSVRLIAEARSRPSGSPDSLRRVAVVGAGEAGAMVARELQRNPQLGIEAVGFLDDASVKWGKRIQGVPVLGGTDKLEEAVTSFGLDEVIIAMPSAPGSAVRAVVESCRRVGVASRTLPGVFELIDGQVSVSRLREIQITDLLRRTPAACSPAGPAYLAGRTVLITGAGGSIGSELCRQVARAGPATLVLLGHGENSIFEISGQLRQALPRVSLACVVADIRDQRRLDAVFDRFRPDVVFHAAAHKHVPLMEENPEEAVTNNILGTYNVVTAAGRVGARRLVMISSDKAVEPSSVMGASKRVAEAVVRDAARRFGHAFVTVRFGNVLGSRGSVVPLFKRQIEQGGPITITHPEMTRFFMTIPEAVHLVLEAGGLGDGGELFVLNMGQPLRIVDLAEDMIRLSGMDPGEIRIVYTGLRPGEKLEEQLWEADSQVAPTKNGDVLRVTEPNGDPSLSLDHQLQWLRAAAESGSREKILETLQACLPAGGWRVEGAGAGGAAVHPEGGRL